MQQIERETAERETAQAEAADDAALKQQKTLRLWRYSERGLAKLVARRIKALLAIEQLQTEEDRRVRQLTALVLSAHRAKEMENQYDQQAQLRAAGAAGESSDAAERQRREQAAYDEARAVAERVVAEMQDELAGDRAGEASPGHGSGGALGGVRP